MHDSAQTQRPDRRASVSHASDCSPAPHLHSQQVVCRRQCERHGQQHRRPRDTFRLGMLSDLFTATMAIFLTLALYRLFKGVDEGLARLVVILGALMVTPIYFFNTVNDAAALLLARGADFLSVFDKPQRDALVRVFLRMHGQGVLANEVFWGLWLFPFGLLVYKSRFIPRILGVWLMLNCFAYLATSVTGILWPQYEQRVSNWVFPVMLGELAIMLWLIIVGAKERQPLATTA